MTIEELAWGENGLLPVVIEDAAGGGVLTLAYANREALARTLDERTTWLFSRSRGRLWKKGETSGHTQAVIGVRYDCDADALLYRVRPHGPACHTGAASCFSGALLDDTAAGDRPAGDAFARALEHLGTTIAARRGASPESSYTAKLLAGGIDRIAKKVGEEATEVVIAAKNGAPDEIAWEVADLFYHTLVLLEERGVSLEAVGAELLRRAK
jgi:phosphoribosyl-ATP pyrophosphohydrolase/phosphoribosyl-AMP cyclohydrolase